MDNIVITSNDQDGIQKLKQHLFDHLQTKYLGKLKYFLGIEIAQSKSGVVMSQRKYVLDVLEETGILDCKPVDTPMDPNVKLVAGQGEPLRDPGRYQQLMGRLNYLTITRSNISSLVSVVSQFLLLGNYHNSLSSRFMRGVRINRSSDTQYLRGSAQTCLLHGLL